MLTYTMSDNKIKLPSIQAMLRGESCESYQPPISTRCPTPSLPTQPYSKGWFDIEQPEVAHTIEWTRDMDRDELYNLVFTVDDSRPRYEVENVGECQEIYSADSPKSKHKKCEKNRRIRHRKWQKKAHAMTPEAAHEAAERDPEYFAGKFGGGRKATSGKKHSGQKPGKDEQLCSIIYTVVLLALACQSEHNGRKQAEERAYQAEARLAELTGTSPRSPRKRRMSDVEPLHVTVSPKKRTFHPPYHGPPSPCTTACLSPSPTPTLSASSNFSAGSLSSSFSH